MLRYLSYAILLILGLGGCNQVQDIKDAYFPEKKASIDTVAIQDTLAAVAIDSSAHYLEELPAEWKEIWAYGGQYAFLMDCQQRILTIKMERDSIRGKLGYFTKYGIDTIRVEVSGVEKYFGSKMDFHSLDVNYTFEVVEEGSESNQQFWKLQLDTTSKVASWFFTAEDEATGNYTSMVGKELFADYPSLFSGPCLPDSCIPNPDSTLVQCPRADSLLIGEGVAKMLVVAGGIYQFYESATDEKPVKVLKLDAKAQPKGDVSWLEPMERNWDSEQLHFICFQETESRLEILSSQTPYRRLWVDRIMVEEYASWKDYWSHAPRLEPLTPEALPLITEDPQGNAALKIPLSCAQAVGIEGDWLLVKPNPDQCGKKEGRGKKENLQGYLRWKKGGELLLKAIWAN